VPQAWDQRGELLQLEGQYGTGLSEAKRLKGLESENAKLKKLLADAMLDNAALKDLLAKNAEAHRRARACRSPAFCVQYERAAGVQDEFAVTEVGAITVHGGQR